MQFTKGMLAPINKLDIFYLVYESKCISFTAHLHLLDLWPSRDLETQTDP